MRRPSALIDNAAMKFGPEHTRTPGFCGIGLATRVALPLLGKGLRERRPEGLSVDNLVQGFQIVAKAARTVQPIRKIEKTWLSHCSPLKTGPAQKLPDSIPSDKTSANFSKYPQATASASG